jgi:Tfp pilus assembly PilM family ATPase
MFGLFQTPLCLGLDLSPSGIVVAELRIKNKQFQMARLLEQDCSQALDPEGRVRDWEALQRLLNPWVEEHALTGRGVAVSLPDALIQVGQFTVSFHLPLADIEADLFLQVQQRWPYLPDIEAMDFQVIEQQAEHQTIWVAVTSKAYLSKYVACLSRAGLVVKVAESTSQALARFQSHVLEGSMESARYHCAMGLAMQEQPSW